jgi:hypothetical protein
MIFYANMLQCIRLYARIFDFEETKEALSDEWAGVLASNSAAAQFFIYTSMYSFKLDFKDSFFMFFTVFFGEFGLLVGRKGWDKLSDADISSMLFDSLKFIIFGIVLISVQK